MVHALKALPKFGSTCWISVDKPFELHTDKSSLLWLQQERHRYRHVSHHQVLWLNLLAVAQPTGKYQYRVAHIPRRTNPANFLTRKRFCDDPCGPGHGLRRSGLGARALCDISSSPSLRLAPTPVRLASCTRVSLLANPVFGLQASALLDHPTPPTPAPGPHCSLVLLVRAERAPVTSEASRLVHSRGRLAALQCVAGAPRHPSWGALRA